MLKGNIFDIQRFCVHDGPGIRTVVFFKGCSLRCWWCHNPESQQKANELQHFPDKCIGCLKCIQVCPSHAHNMESGEKVFRVNRCDVCGACAAACSAKALVIAGKEMDVSAVMVEIGKDKEFYLDSGGGVTLSGGEPLLQPAFAAALLQQCKQEGMGTAIETAGYVAWKSFEEVLPYTDLFLVDLKCMDAERHTAGTGAGNTLILDNLQRLCNRDVSVVIRIAVIPGFNDTVENMEASAHYIASLKGVKQVELLRFHNMGTTKYQSLHRQYRGETVSAPVETVLEEYRQIFWKYSISC